MDDLFGSNEQADPQSDFLARERAALGADASSFAPSSDSAALDKDYEAGASAFPDLDDADDDALGAFTGSQAPAPAAPAQGQVSVTGDNEFAAFEQEYPEIDLPSDEPHQNGLNGNPSAPPSAGLAAPASFGQAPSQSASPALQQQEGESEFIKSWRDKQAQEIAAREDEYARRKEETIAKARNDIDNFYKEYNAKKEKAIAQNKEDEEKFKAELTDSLAKGTTWERICQLVDLQDSRSKTTTKSKQDLTRFKELLLSLRREGETAPGAAGY
ncbi:uncharacterized protein RHOBADRAFT_34500 [Rhodotorula graminis WP1]|uniref:Clathrin light chain n=1 Tax=Rhodotorula graminis (strain WP1) TaxID=578459 RepID=A0A194S8W5_RHOGW|nr:uncharacterized protein RHOBADRAFT_34500 [Rhodotorula graminis WP1]KPV77037.1 hypothetical protein RHOBADRAFT_34500 [Rhodotorula graminis WP1]